MFEEFTVKTLYGHKTIEPLTYEVVTLKWRVWRWFPWWTRPAWQIICKQTGLKLGPFDSPFDCAVVLQQLKQA